jgi:hypothetical protein
LTALNSSQAAPPGITLKMQAVEFDSCLLIANFGRAFDPNDVVDLQLVEQLE